MDKYEYQVCVEQIKNFIAEQKYVEAMEVADTIDWRRVKSVSMLCTVSEIYKYNKRYEESRDILLLAYERHPSGRMIIYSLCELSIKMNDIVQAVEYYKEFVRVAPGDTGSYILLYKIYEAQDVSLEERIKVLEELKRRDYKEKWSYELAKLYHKTGQEAKCVDECKELEIWFGEGKYVDKARKLMAMHAGAVNRQNQGGNMTAPQEMPAYTGAATPGGELSSSKEEPAMPASEVTYNTSNLQNVLQQSMEQYLGDKAPEGYVTADLGAEESIPKQPGIVVQQVEQAVPEKTQEFVLDPNNKYVQQFVNQLKEASKGVSETLGEEKAVQEAENISAAAEETPLETPESGPEEAIKAREGGLEEVLMAQGKDPEEALMAQGKSAEEVLMAQGKDLEEVLMAQGKGSEDPDAEGEEAPSEEEASSWKALEGTEALTDEDKEKLRAAAAASAYAKKKEIARKYEAILGQELGGQIHMSIPDEDMIERQITGQINIEEILRSRNEKLRIKFGDTDELMSKLKGVIPEGESVKSVEDSRPIIAQMSAPTALDIEIQDEEKKNALEEREKLLKEEEEKAKDEDKEDDIQTEDDMPEDIEEQDLEDTEEGKESEEDGALTGGESPKEETPETEDSIKEQVQEGSETDANEALPEEEKESEGTEDASQEENQAPAFEYELEDYGEIEEFEDIEQPDEVDAIIRTSNLPLEEIEVYNAMAEQAIRAVNTAPEPKPLPPNYDDSGRMKHPSYMVLEEERKSRRDFDEDEYKLFGRYDGIESVKAQLVDVLDDMSMEPGVGNVVIMGDEVSCRKAMAIDIVKAMQAVDSSFKGKVAKISGEALNKKNIPATLNKLTDGALIIEEAGGLSAAALTIIAQSLSRDVESILVVLEGSRESIMPLLDSNRVMFDTVFDARIDIKEFNNDDLVAYARGYAREKEHSIDEMGVLALYTRIGELQALDNKVTIEDIKDIIDAAIVHVDKMTIAHLMDVLVSKRYDDDDFIIIREKDFMLDGKKRKKKK